MEQLSFEEGQEKITRQMLLELAQVKPLRAEEVRTMLLKWLEETGVRDEEGAPSYTYTDVAIMHTLMKYELGFLDREEALSELEESRVSLASEKGKGIEEVDSLYERLCTRIYEIEDGTFEIVNPSA